MLDIFYLTYDGDYSQKNMNRIMELSSHGQRVTVVAGIEGIYNAHRECSLLSLTDHFFVIDGDAYLREDFDLGFVPSTEKMIYPNTPESECTLVWRAYNPVARITYGYGGVKLFHQRLFEDDNQGNLVDMSTTIARKGLPYYAVNEVSNDTCFNTSPFNAWKGAFRECAKLSSNQVTHELQQERIAAWLKPDPYVEFSNYARIGARMGNAYGKSGNDMTKVNDWEWLKTVFEELAE